MSIAFDSGGRQRPVAVDRDDGDEIVIDGTRLKQLRIERGLSVADAARLVTLSREQVEQIENGGLGAFYGARHKLLAVRKYAEGFGLTLEALLPKPAPVAEPVPEPATAPEPGSALEPVQQTVPDTDSAAVAEAAVEVSGAPIEPAPVFSEAPSAVISHPSGDEHAEASSTMSGTMMRRLPLALVVGVALVLVFSILRGLTPEQAPAELPPVEPAAEATPSGTPSGQTQDVQTPAAVTPDVTAATAPVAPVATNSPAPAVAGSTSSSSSAQVAPPSPAAPSTPPATAAVTAAAAPTSQQAQVASASDACALTAGPDTPRWAPAQGRNSSTRVFVTSSAPIDVCVTDANGVATPLKVKPGAMFSASGKPPYVVRSERLSQAQIFLQGLKVRVPSSAVAVHLITTSSVRLPETPPPSEQ